MSVDKKMPEIRFKGFSEAWEKYPLVTFISTLDAGVSVNSGDRPANENEFGILKTSCVTNGFFEPNENKVVFKTEEISRLKEPVLENTIIISRMNTPALVGANAYISKSYANYFLPDRLWAAKPSSIGDLRFIAYILGSDKGRRALSDLATGTSGSMKNISKPAVLELEFRTPAEEKEQIQIGNYFQKLDALINQHQQKHDKLSNIKKALLEKMFPKQGKTMPEIRLKEFSEKWEEKELREIGSFSSGVGFSESEQSGKSGIPFFKVSDMNLMGNDCYMASANNYVNDEQILRLNYTPTHETSILFAKVGAAIFLERKRIAKDFLIDNNMMAFSPTQDIIFMKQWFDSISLSKHTQVGALPSLKASDLGKIKLKIPKREEQTQIGNFFQKLDELINQHQQQIIKLNNIKQACLSKMFV